MSDISNPHDRFVRETFSRPEVARGLARHYLPADVVAVLDLDRMELVPGTFIDPDLREQVTDLLDLSQYSDEEIRGAALERIALLVLKYSREDELLERLPEIAELFQLLEDATSALDYLRRVMIYLAFVNNNLTEEDVGRAIDLASLPAGRETIMPTLVSEWIEKGRQEGIEEGIEQGTRNNIIDLLIVRFPEEAEDNQELITLKLAQIHEATDLRELLRQAALADSFLEFQQVLATYSA